MERQKDIRRRRSARSSPKGKALVIFNPAARGEKAKHVRERIVSLSDKIDLRETDSPGDAEAIAERAVAQGYGVVIAAGGDGTVNQVVNGIGQANVTLGVLPLGTMNVFARELAIPERNLRRAWEIIEAGNARRIDLPRANDQYFVQLAGIGLDAQVVKETSYDFRKNFGPLSYLISASQIVARKPPRIRVKPAEGQAREGCFLLIGNGRYYGGPFLFFKDARPDDGLLDVLLFQHQAHLDVIRYLQGVITGSHLQMPDVEYFQSRHLHVSSDEAVPVEVDGEVVGSVPVTFRFSRRRLRVLAP